MPNYPKTQRRKDDRIGEDLISGIDQTTGVRLGRRLPSLGFPHSLGIYVLGYLVIYRPR